LIYNRARKARRARGGIKKRIFLKLREEINGRKN